MFFLIVDVCPLMNIWVSWKSGLWFMRCSAHRQTQALSPTCDCRKLHGDTCSSSVNWWGGWLKRLSSVLLCVLDSPQVSRVGKDAQMGRNGVQKKDWHDYERIRRDASRSGESKLCFHVLHLHMHVEAAGSWIHLIYRCLSLQKCLFLLHTECTFASSWFRMWTRRK